MWLISVVAVLLTVIVVNGNQFELKVECVGTRGSLHCAFQKQFGGFTWNFGGVSLQFWLLCRHNT